MSYDDNTLFSETILEQEEEDEEAEEICEKYLDTDEKLLAIIDGKMDGEAGLNCLALTDKRVIFCPRGKGLISAFRKTRAREMPMYTCMRCDASNHHLYMFLDALVRVCLQ